MVEGTKRWFACWGGPVLVLVIILVGTVMATLVLRELRPCGWLDAALRGDDCLCKEIDFADSPSQAGEFIP